MHLDGEEPVRRRDDDAPADAQRLGDEPPLPLATSDVLDHRVREDDVERPVLERERAGVPLHVADAGIATAEARAVVETEGRNSLRPGVELLEEVEGPAPALVPEAELVGSDVEHRRLRRRLKLVEKEAQLAFPRTKRDSVDEPHARKYPFRHGQ